MLNDVACYSIIGAVFSCSPCAIFACATEAMDAGTLGRQVASNQDSKALLCFRGRAWSQTSASCIYQSCGLLLLDVGFKAAPVQAWLQRSRKLSTAQRPLR